MKQFRKKSKKLFVIVFNEMKLLSLHKKEKSKPFEWDFFNLCNLIHKKKLSVNEVITKKEKNYYEVKNKKRDVNGKVFWIKKNNSIKEKKTLNSVTERKKFHKLDDVHRKFDVILKHRWAITTTHRRYVRKRTETQTELVAPQRRGTQRLAAINNSEIVSDAKRNSDSYHMSVISNSRFHHRQLK